MIRAASPAAQHRIRVECPVKASAITGCKVFNREGEDIGNVEEMLIDIARGEVAYFVLSFGGFLGMAEKRYAVPCNRLKFDNDQEAYVLSMSREQIEMAPLFEDKNESLRADSDWRRRLGEYFDTLPFWNL